MLKRWLIVAALVLIAAGAALAGIAWHLHRRALPDYGASVTVRGPGAPVEILRDRWGVPHIFARSVEDAAFAHGWAVAQDRLFQIELLRRLTQGRLSELVGKDALDTDKLFRALNFHGHGRRMLAAADSRAQRLSAAYAQGVNAYAEHLDGKLPIEFTLLGADFAPLAGDEMTGIIGFMAFGLLDAWKVEPLLEQLAAKLGPQRFARLFPDVGGAALPAYPAAALPRPEWMLAAADSMARLGMLSAGPAGSNNWAVAPAKSASGHAMLANDPHLSLALPGIWHEVHISTPQLEVAGVAIPGLPFVAIGHTRDIAWGLTNLMVDSGDFFLEKINPTDPGQVMHQGRWVPITERKEIFRVKGGDPVTVTVRSTPHGPLVQDLVKGQKEALSFRWSFLAAPDANEFDGFLAINLAKNWQEFRAGVRRMGAVAQNFAYADRNGNIGVQAGGLVPLRKGPAVGIRYRAGWDGSQDWSGYVPFERMPNSYNPRQGWLATANTSPFGRPAPFYLSSTYEPRDRITRIQEVLRGKDKLTLHDLRALQSDHLWLTAKELVPRIKAAYATPPANPAEREALALLERWDGTMTADSPAAAVFAAFFEALYFEIFSDEFGPQLAKDLRARTNLYTNLVRVALDGGAEWLDRVDTPSKDGWPEVARAALGKAVARLGKELGGAPKDWAWGRVHTFEVTHPLGRLRVLAPYFNRGPYPVPGHSHTVGKLQFEPESFRVNHGASMRQVTDFADLNSAVSVLPGGESGIPASPYYADQLQLWLAGDHHPFPMDRATVERVTVAKQRLVPGARQ
jgi:penicillin amidase